MIRIPAFELKSPAGEPLREISEMELAPGELLLITGPNGAGKSSLLKSLSSFSQIKALQVVMLPQKLSEGFPLPISVDELLESSNRSEAWQRLLDQWGVKALYGRSWLRLSGGEKKKLLILRKLAQDSDVLFLDEPLNHLDQESLLHFEDYLTSILSSGECKNVFLVSHQAFFRKEHAFVRRMSLA